jgi:hypothetical protein
LCYPRLLILLKLLIFRFAGCAENGLYANMRYVKGTWTVIRFPSERGQAAEDHGEADDAHGRAADDEVPGARGQTPGLRSSTSCHTFRATGITAYLENGGTIAGKAGMPWRVRWRYRLRPWGWRYNRVKYWLRDRFKKKDE